MDQEQTFTIEELATKLRDAKQDQKDFKKKHKDVFKENTIHNKNVRTAMLDLVAKMKEDDTNIISVDGFEFELKVRKRPAHNMETLYDIMADEDKVKEYENAINVDSVNVATRKSKVPKNE